MALSFSVFNKFKAIDGVTAPVRRMQKSVGKFGVATVKTFERADRASTKFANNLDGIGKSMSTSVSAPIALMGALALKTAIDFDTAFTGVMKTVDATSAEFAILKKDLIDLSRTIPISTEEIFNIAEAAGQLGIKTKDIVKFTKVMADLGATTNMTSEEAATSLARFANIADISSDDFGRLGSTIVGLGNNFATTEGEIVAMALRLGAAGKLVGLTAAETLGLSAALSSVGIEAEAGGTAFSQVMIRINKEIGTGSKKMSLFAKTSGKTVGQFEKMWKDDAAGALLTFIEGLKKTQDMGENVNIVLDDLGLSGIRISDSLLRAAGASDLFNRAIASGTKDWEENIALTKEANLRYGTIGSKMTLLWNSVKILGASFGDVLIPVLTILVDILIRVAQRFEKMNKSTKIIIIVIGSLIAIAGPLLVVIAAITASIGVLTAVGLPLIGTILLIGIAIAVVIAAIVLFITYFDEIKAKVVEVSRAILGFVSDMLSRLAGMAGVAGKAIAMAVSAPLQAIANKMDSMIKGTIDNVTNKAKKVMGFFGFGDDDEEQAQEQQGQISPNSGVINTIRQETENRASVDVNFSNVPVGTEINQDEQVPGFNLNTGFAGAT